MNRLCNLTLHHPGKKGSFFRPSEKENGGALWAPAVDIIDEKDHLRVRADLPGMKKEEIEVSVDNDTLTIRGEKREEREIKERITSGPNVIMGLFTGHLLCRWAWIRKKSTPGIKTASLRSLFPNGKMPSPNRSRWISNRLLVEGGCHAHPKN